MKRMHDNHVAGRFLRFFIMWWYIIKKFHKPLCWPRQVDCYKEGKCCLIGFSYEESDGDEKLYIVWWTDDIKDMYEDFEKEKKEGLKNEEGSCCWK